MRKKESLKKKIVMILTVTLSAAAGIVYVAGLEDEGNNIVRSEQEKTETKTPEKKQTSVSDEKNTATKKQESSSEDTQSLTREEGKININKASISELTTLKGIGPTKAERIAGFRESHGEFKTIEDLMLVPGIKEGTFSKIKDSICVGPQDTMNKTSFEEEKNGSQSSCS